MSHLLRTSGMTTVKYWEMTPAGLSPAGTATSWAAPRCQRTSVSGLGISDRGSGLGRTRLIAAISRRSLGCQGGTASLALKHRELGPQDQHFGAKPGLGPVPGDQDFEQEANHDIHEGVEHEPGVSHRGPRRSGWGPPGVAYALRARQSRVNAILTLEPTEQRLTIHLLLQRALSRSTERINAKRAPESGRCCGRMTRTLKPAPPQAYSPSRWPEAGSGRCCQRS